MLTQKLIVKILILFSFNFLLLSTETQLQTRKPVRRVTSNASLGGVGGYIQALQSKDLKKIIDLTLHYQRDVGAIKAHNPQALWVKLVGEYYSEKISNLSSGGGFWQEYGDSLGAMVGDPSGDIRMAMYLLTPDSKWSISESRAERIADSIVYGPHNRTAVYVVVKYPRMETSPEIKKRFLKQTMLRFDVHGRTNLTMSIARVAEADEYWGKPYPPAGVPRLLNQYRSEFLNARSSEGARAVVINLVKDLEWAESEPLLRELFEQRVGFFLEALYTLALHGNKDVVPGVFALVKERFSGKLTQRGCGDRSENLMLTLRMIGKTDFPDAMSVLREALSNTISAIPLESGEYVQCVQSYLNVMAIYDSDERWTTFPFWHDGSIQGPDGTYTGNDFRKVLVDVIKLPIQVRAAESISHETLRRLERLKRTQPGVFCPKAGCPMRLSFEYVIIRSPTQVEIFGHADEFDSRLRMYGDYKTVESFKLIANRNNDPSRPWLITGILDPTSSSTADSLATRVISPVPPPADSMSSASEQTPIVSGQWLGHWNDNSGNVFAFEMTLTRTPSNRISGSILWTLKKTDRADLRRKVGLTATEHVAGTYDPATRQLNFGGYRKDDSYDVIGLDTYVILLSLDGQTLSGSTKSGGTWEGKFSAVRKQ